MTGYQIVAFLILMVYYTSYLAKLFGQRRKGIQTTQLGKGDKSKRTMVVEKILQIVSVGTVIVEVVSVLLNCGLQMPSLFRFIGILCSALGTGIFIFAMITMQDSWRAGIPTEDKTGLVTSGIYRFSRNPAFLGFDLVYIGMGIAFFNVGLMLVSIVGMVMMHLQILEEEKFLSKVFGEEYEIYKNNVGRYLFKIG